MAYLQINKNHGINLDGLASVNFGLELNVVRRVTLTFVFIDGSHKSFDSLTYATEAELIQASQNVFKN